MLAQLVATENVLEVAVHRGSVAVMALHGGLERGTYAMAAGIAERAEASLYAVVQPDDFFWHVPSAAYDPEQSERLAAILDGCTYACSIHGFGRPGLDDAILVGGSNRKLAAVVGAHLRRSGLRAIDDIESIPDGLRGLHPANPVNLARGGGVQLELSAAVRRSPLSEQVIGAVVDAFARWRSASR